MQHAGSLMDCDRCALIGIDYQYAPFVFFIAPFPSFTQKPKEFNKIRHAVPRLFIISRLVQSSPSENPPLLLYRLDTRVWVGVYSRLRRRRTEDIVTSVCVCVCGRSVKTDVQDRSHVLMNERVTAVLPRS